MAKIEVTLQFETLLEQTRDGLRSFTVIHTALQHLGAKGVEWSGDNAERRAPSLQMEVLADRREKPLLANFV